MLHGFEYESLMHREMIFYLPVFTVYRGLDGFFRVSEDYICLLQKYEKKQAHLMACQSAVLFILDKWRKAVTQDCASMAVLH